MIATECLEKIRKIEKLLKSNDHVYESMGLNNGLLGMALFNYYSYLYTGKESYLDKMSNYISASFNGFDEKYTGFSSVHDIMEIGHFLFFLKKEEVLDELDAYLKDADEIVLDFLNEQLALKNIDPVSGSIAAGYYLLNRQERKDGTDSIKRIIVLLEQQAMYEEKGKIYWYNNFHDPNKLELQLGIMHGVSGIVNFLLSVYEKQILPERSKEMAMEALDFLLSYKKDKGVNLFPFEILTNEQIQYQNLCYGDIGIGYVLLRAGKLFKNPEFLTQGAEIIENASRFRDDPEEYITDANLLYGAAGLFSFFASMSQFHSAEVSINQQSLQEASEYWYDKVMTMNKYDTPWLGYKASFNDHAAATQLCFAEGIAGIGITLMNSELENKNDYLSFFNYKKLTQ